MLAVVKNVTLVGSSLGGFIALEIAIKIGDTEVRHNNYLTKVARDAVASKIGVGKTPSRIVTIAAIQIVRLV